MNKEEIIEIIEEQLHDIDNRTGQNKANAYGVRIQDFYAIELRDKFCRLDGEYNALITLKNRIIDLDKE